MKVAFILNPAANRGSKARRWKKLEAVIKDHWPEARIEYSSCKGDIERKARSMAGSSEAVVVAGGDGSVQELVRGLSGTGCIGGLIPAGSGNDFARCLGIPRDPARVVRELRGYGIRGVDGVQITVDGVESSFLNTLGIGFNGWANHYAAHFTHLRGSFKYLGAVLLTLFRYKGQSFSICIDGRESTVEALMFTIANGTTEGGGFQIAPKASPFDTYLDIVMIEKMPAWKLIIRLPFLLFKKQPSFKSIQRWQCKHVLIHSNQGSAVHADGEQLGLKIQTLEAKIIPSEVAFLCPANNK
jgi:diacylglycerol kinase (ATP)